MYIAGATQELERFNGLEAVRDDVTAEVQKFRCGVLYDHRDGNRDASSATEATGGSGGIQH